MHFVKISSTNVKERQLMMENKLIHIYLITKGKMVKSLYSEIFKEAKFISYVS